MSRIHTPVPQYGGTGLAIDRWLQEGIDPSKRYYSPSPTSTPARSTNSSPAHTFLRSATPATSYSSTTPSRPRTPAHPAKIGTHLVTAVPMGSDLRLDVGGTLFPSRPGTASSTHTHSDRSAWPPSQHTSIDRRIRSTSPNPLSTHANTRPRNAPVAPLRQPSPGPPGWTYTDQGNGLPPSHIAFSAVFHFNEDGPRFWLDVHGGSAQFKIDRNLCLTPVNENQIWSLLKKQQGLQFWLYRGSLKIRSSQLTDHDYKAIRARIRDNNAARRTSTSLEFTVQCELQTRRVGGFFKRRPRFEPVGYEVRKAFLDRAEH